MILKASKKPLKHFSDTARCEQAGWGEYCSLLEPIRLQDLWNTAYSRTEKKINGVHPFLKLKQGFVNHVILYWKDFQCL